jgi:flagellar P-ring protein precursor FlgI
VDFAQKEKIRIMVRNPDFTTVDRIVNAVNAQFQDSLAEALDAVSLMIRVPESYRDQVVRFTSMLERIDISPDSRARIILDERTGTVVISKDVCISTVAVAHGNLSILISSGTETQTVVTPEIFSERTERSDVVQATEEMTTGGPLGEQEADQLVLVPEGVSISEVVKALNAIGVTPRDLIAIFKAMKAAGALQADLEII